MSDKIVPVPVKSEPDAVASGSVATASNNNWERSSEPEAGVAKKVKKEPQPDTDEIVPVPVKSEPDAVEDDQPTSITNNLKRFSESDTVGNGLVASAKKIKKEPESDGEEDPVEPRGTDPTLSHENDAAVKATKKIQEDWEEFKTEKGVRIKHPGSPFLCKKRDDYGRRTKLVRIPRPGSAGENAMDFICIGRMVNGNCGGEKTGTCALFHGDNGIFCVQDVDAVSSFLCVPCAPVKDESESTSQNDEESKRLLERLRNAWEALNINITDRNSPYMEWTTVWTKNGKQESVKKLKKILRPGSEERICLIKMLKGSCSGEKCYGKNKCKGFHGTEVTIEGSTVFVFDIEDIRVVANAGGLVVDGL